MKKTLIVAAILALAVFSAPAAALAQLDFNGAPTMADGFLKDAAKAFEDKTKVKFGKWELTTSGDGFNAVMEGKCTIAGVAAEISAEQKKLNPYFIIVGYDAIVIYVNEKNPVKGLKKDQLKGIFSGKITNWKEVGGADAKILVGIEKNKTSGGYKEIKKTILDGGDFGPAANEAENPKGCVDYVIANEHAISYTSTSWSAPGVKMLELDGIAPTAANIKSAEYYMVRPMHLVTKEVPKGELKDFIDFVLSPDGQAIVGKKFTPAK